MIIVMQQQSGDAQFVQQTEGRILKEHLKKKRQKNGGKWHLHRKTCNCEESSKRILFRIYLRNIQLCLLHTQENAEWIAESFINVLAKLVHFENMFDSWPHVLGLCTVRQDFWSSQKERHKQQEYIKKHNFPRHGMGSKFPSLSSFRHSYQCLS